MMRKPLFAVLGIVVIALLAATPLFAVDEIFEITGKILEVQNGNTTTVAISVPEEGDVAISKVGKGMELSNHIGATVEVKGRFSESQFGSIDVISYKIRKPD